MFREEVAEHYRAKGYTIRENVKVRGQSGAVHHCDMVAQSPLGNLVIAFEDAGGFQGPEMNAVKRVAHDVGATPVVAAQRVPAGVPAIAARQGVVLLDAPGLQEVEAEEGDDVEPEGPEYPPWPGTADDEEREDETVAWPRSARARPETDGPMQTEDLDAVVGQWQARNRRPAPTKSTDPGFWTYPRDGSDPAEAQAPPAAAERDASARGQGGGPTASKAGGSFAWLATAQDSPQEPPTPRTARAKTVLRPDSLPPATETVARPAATKMPFWQWLVLAAAFGATTGGVFYALAALFG